MFIWFSISLNFSDAGDVRDSVTDGDGVMEGVLVDSFDDLDYGVSYGKNITDIFHNNHFKK